MTELPALQPPSVTPGPVPDTLTVTRSKVRELLERSEAFNELTPQERRDIAHQMVRIGSYMADPDGLLSAEHPTASPNLAQQQSRPSAGGVKSAADRASSDPGFAGQDFVGGAMREGTQQFGELVGKVDFPRFVGGLIQNVYQAIVTSSIQQMRAYSEMLKSVSQSVDDFARENISENNARDWLVDTYPDVFAIEAPSPDDAEDGTPQPRLVTRGDDSETRLATISRDMMLPQPLTDISDPESEAALVRGARMSMAKSRMQLLASMVMLGINRIVVTDGSIRAKVVFGMRAEDKAQRTSSASLYDRQSSRNTNVSAVGFGFLGIGGGSVNVNEQSHMTTVGSALDETSTSNAELKANLSGEVRLNFKSDFLAAEKLATPEMIAAIQGNAVPQQPARLAQPPSTAPVPPASSGSAAAGAAAPR